MAWAPLLFLSIDGFFEKQSLPWALLGMLAISMQILAGYPQHFFYTALAAALYSILRMVKTRQRIPVISGLAIMYAGAAALGAVQLLTGIDLARQSVRSGNFLSDFVSKFSLPPENLVTLIAPDFFGNDMTFPYWGRWYAWEMTFFVGITGLFLALYGSIYGERSVRRFSVTMASVLTLLALGPATPLFGILHAWLPAFDKFRGTSKFIFQASLFITMLAGVGVDHMIRSSRISWKPILIIAFAAVLVGSGALYILTCIQGSNPANFWQKAMSALRATNQFYIPEGTYLQPRFLENAGFFAAKCLIIAFATLVILLLLYLMARLSRIGVYAIVLLSIVEILLFARNALVSFDATTIQRQDIAHFLANNPGNYRILSPRYPNSAMLTNAKDIWGYDSVVLRRYAEFVSFTQGDPPEKASQYVLFSRLHPLFALLRCRFFFLPEGNDTRIIENQSVLPHVQLVENYRVIPNRDGILAAMTDPSFNPRQMVILEREPEPEPSMCNQQGTARVVDSSTDHLTIEARLPASAILLITDAYSEGWHASALAGSSQGRYEVMPADYVLRAIPLSQGYHRIRLEYLPLAFRIGKWTSIASAVIYIILLAFCTRKMFRGQRFTKDRLIRTCEHGQLG
jgi:hypothetical protein